ncbi:hypothetical protein E5163_08015 [Marinicauda algicola]|uniref:Uncharacterized protein n=1 Tax=Marinicauda algicola TaxID=2029849 RepID=A0A4S2H0W4_9PROT|nr:hypothetical protein [Marinicauda algicola]TGY89064.1 hypothetical protein E5163_08015 [Marinicauda algicola]
MAIALYALAALLCGLGVFALRRAWARRNVRHTGALVAGWALVLASLPFWIVASGADRGVSQLVLALSLIAIALVLATGGNAGARRERALRDPGQPAPPPSRGLVLRRLGVFAIAGPGALAASILLSVPAYAGLAHVAATEADRLALILFFVPILFAALTTLAVLDFPLRWRAGLIGGAIAAGGLATLAFA